jgi:hypothetical protein
MSSSPLIHAKTIFTQDVFQFPHPLKVINSSPTSEGGLITITSPNCQELRDLTLPCQVRCADANSQAFLWINVLDEDSVSNQT